MLHFCNCVVVKNLLRGSSLHIHLHVVTCHIYNIYEQLDMAAKLPQQLVHVMHVLV